MKFLNQYSKEAVTASFYILYFLAAALLYWLFPGDKNTPNFGVVLFFLFIPISFVYASIHIYRHFMGKTSYLKCILIHTLAWCSVLMILGNFVKK